MKQLLLCAALIGSGAQAQTDAERANFVEANVLSILYHEIGHAVIDLMDVPIFGQEEDAADTMAVLLIDALYEEEAAQAIAYDSAFGYINDPEGTQEVAYWGLHGPDEQRYFNHVCLFYGANPDDREELAADLGLPQERADTCPDEFDQAISSWGVILDEMASEPGKPAFAFAPSGPTTDIAALLDDEISALNSDFSLPQTVEIRLEPCDEANAFYDPEEVSIIFCTEFIPHLEELFDKL